MSLLHFVLCIFASAPVNIFATYCLVYFAALDSQRHLPVWLRLVLNIPLAIAIAPRTYLDVTLMPTSLQDYDPLILRFGPIPYLLLWYLLVPCAVYSIWLQLRYVRRYLRRCEIDSSIGSYPRKQELLFFRLSGLLWFVSFASMGILYLLSP